MENKNNLIENPVVSAKVITYNHENYIRQCLDGIMMQKTNFPFEVIIGEDCSTDGTKAICEEFKARFPEQINLLSYPKNVGVAENARRTRAECRGKYVAICDGDDYWTDPLKLQKQFDFMERNKDVALCFHAAENIYKDSRRNYTQRAGDKNTFFSVKDIIVKGGGFIPTASMFFRSSYSYVNELPSWFNNTPVGDYPLAIFLSLNSKVGYLNEVMSVYRRGVDGAWSGGELTLKKIASVNKGVRELLMEINADTRGQYFWPITQKISKDYYDLAKAYLYFKLKALKLK